MFYSLIHKLQLNYIYKTGNNYYHKKSIINKWYKLIHKLNDHKKSIINRWYKLLHKLKLNEIYEIGNDYYYQYVFNKSYIKRYYK